MLYSCLWQTRTFVWRRFTILNRWEEDKGTPPLRGSGAETNESVEPRVFPADWDSVWISQSFSSSPSCLQLCSCIVLFADRAEVMLSLSPLAPWTSDQLVAALMLLQTCRDRAPVFTPTREAKTEAGRVGLYHWKCTKMKKKCVRSARSASFLSVSSGCTRWLFQSIPNSMNYSSIQQLSENLLTNQLFLFITWSSHTVQQEETLLT